MTYITPHEKQRIFGLYHGQEIALFRGHLYNIVGLHNETDVLHVKSLSNITDEHAIEVAKFMDWETPESKEDMRQIRDELLVKIKYNWVTWVCVDFLRSNGYALPAFGYSVDELVKQNIFQIDNGKES